MNDKPSKPYVIGQQYADALGHEQARLNAGTASSSPLPQGKYEWKPCEFDLLNPTISELDIQIRQSCKTFSNLPQSERVKFTAAISMDEFYKLIKFARRTSVFALRVKDTDFLRDGLIALAMIEVKRADFRDISWALALLYHTASRIGLDARSIIQDVAKLGEPEVTKLMSRFLEAHSNKNLRDSWGYSEVETEYGIGFVAWGFKTYTPKLDLLSRAMKIGQAVDADVYHTDSIQLATEFPGIWLQTSASVPFQKSQITGCVTITARLIPDAFGKAKSQQFTVFLMEMDSSNSANAFLNLSRIKSPKDYWMLGFTSGAIFCLVIARSFVKGDPAFENQETLNRFQDPIQQAID